MKLTTTRLCISILIVFALSACNQLSSSSEQTESNISDEKPTQTDDMPAYDPAMDSWNIGGEAVKKITDTLGVKMYEFTAKPGETVSMHSHPDHLVYVLEGGKLELYTTQIGKLDTLSFPAGVGLINGPLSDSGRNIGSTTIKMLIADIYRPRNK